MPSQDMGFSFIGRGVALSSQPTVEMRAELEKAGVKPPDDDDQLKISQAVDKATGSFNDFKGSVTDKVTELKRSTESSD